MNWKLNIVVIILSVVICKIYFVRNVTDVRNILLLHILREHTTREILKKKLKVKPTNFDTGVDTRFELIGSLQNGVVQVMDVCTAVLKCIGFTIESMKEAGYEGELHYATTEDGYILGLQRIVRGPNTPDSSIKIKRRPLLLIHPLSASAIDWVYYHGNNSLPYLLFEKGYDVWLGNLRGIDVSYNHTSPSIYNNPEKFWNISLHEIGFYDQSAMIDYILNKTGYKKLSYVGISQGEATFLVLTSSRPEYNEKIKVACLLAPSSHLKNSDNNFYKTLGKHWSSIEKYSHMFGVYQLPLRDILGVLCQYKFISSACHKILTPLIGYKNDDQYDLEITTKTFRVYGTSFSFKEFLHYIQIYNTGIFRKYDYGKKGNLEIYGSTEPPEYDLSKIRAPIALFWGENDCWSRPKDIEDITKKLPNLVFNYRVPHKLFSHSDFLLAKDAKKLLYDEVVKTLEKYNL